MHKHTITFYTEGIEDDDLDALLTEALEDIEGDHMTEEGWTINHEPELASGGFEEDSDD